MSDASPPDQIDTLARQALDRPPDERAAFLDEACADADMHEAVRTRMDELEPSDEGDDPDAVPTQAAGGDESSAVPVGKTPDRVGPWRLHEELGRGSMGTVHFAERDDGDFQQKAALKLIRHDLGEDAQERFRTERQILAQLQHPNIAHLLDGGVTDDGRPYFAMEYVDGVPLDTYCNEHSLGVRERLRLFRQVCAAVEFSHRNLVVHRDLKPSNILVTEPGADTAAGSSTGTEPQVKLLDFGIAKALEGAEAGAALTRTGERPMTPLYATPEQVQGDPVTTATDVYALGVVLHELLTGALPYDVQWRSVAKVAQVIANSDPSLPSEQVASETDQSIKDTFDLTPDALRRALEGDLDVMVQKALRKEPERRYPSAAELRQDVERFLDNRPIEARPATTGYRLRRFVSRNRGAVLGAASALVALLIGLGVAVWQAQVAAVERDRAQEQAARAEAVQEFLVDMMDRAAPAVTGGDPLTVKEVLDEAEAELRSMPNHEQIGVRIDVGNTLQKMYRLLNRGDDAIQLGKRTYDASLRQLGPTAPLTFETASQYGASLLRSGNVSKADSVLGAAVARLHTTTTVPPSTRTSLLTSYGESLRRQAKLDSAAIVLQKARRTYDRAALSDTIHRITIGSELGAVRRRQGHLSKAEESYRRALSLASAMSGDASKPAVSVLTNNLANLYRQQGAYARADSMYQRAIATSRTLYGPASPPLAANLTNRAKVLRFQGKLSAADSLSARAVALHREVFAPSDFRTGFALLVRAGVLLDLKRPQEAKAALNEAHTLIAGRLGKDHPRIAEVHRKLSRAHQQMNDLQTAAQHAQTSIRLYTTAYDSTHPDVAAAQSQLGHVRIDQQQYPTAESLLVAAHRVQASDSLTGFHAKTHERFVDLRTAQNRPEDARRWKHHFRSPDSLHSRH